MTPYATPVEIDPHRELITDALFGIGVPHYKGPTAEKAGLAEWDQLTGIHRWKREALATCTVEELQALYTGLKEEQYAG